MKASIKILFAAVALFSFCGSLHAQEQKNGLTWYTDVNQAAKVSDKTNKPIFAFFTGSDWCVWCHRMEQNVFDKQEFKDWAMKNVVLLELDFPRSKKLPDSLAKQNATLQQVFKVQGYPTVWVFTLAKDKATKKFNVTALGSLSYPQAAPGKEANAFLENARNVMKNKKKA